MEFVGIIKNEKRKKAMEVLGINPDFLALKEDIPLVVRIRGNNPPIFPLTGPTNTDITDLIEHVVWLI